jgi:outer membrane protein, heavy metal efflux system
VWFGWLLRKLGCLRFLLPLYRRWLDPAFFVGAVRLHFPTSRSSPIIPVDSSLALMGRSDKPAAISPSLLESSYARTQIRKDTLIHTRDRGHRTYGVHPTAVQKSAQKELGENGSPGIWMEHLMQRRFWLPLLLAVLSTGPGSAQMPQTAQAPTQLALQAWTWEQVKDRLELNNPTLLAGELNISELQAQEITAHLRPNPNLALLSDQIAPFNVGQPHGAFAYLLPSATVSYLHERAHKRELRTESAQKGTAIGISQQKDLERGLLFSLRSAFVQTLQAKAVLQLSRDNLDYYDHVLKISRDRFEAGDIAQIDLDRLELQRVQYESDVQTAEVNLRTAKIQMLMLLNDRTPIEQFDLVGVFDFNDQIEALDSYRQIALDNRPDLKAAIQSVDKAQTDYKLAIANGSTDPTFSLDVGRNPPIDFYFGLDVSFPLRIFDRNQGEKLRTKLDITRNERLKDAAQAQVFNDVDSAYATLNSNLILLRRYKQKYLAQAVRVRETILFSYQHGGASLLDFINAENDYRTVQLSYVNLVGSYLTAAAQLNQAIGREVIQ